jgi:hypothetical protein
MQEENRKTKLSIKRLSILILLIVIVYYIYSWYRGVPLIQFVNPDDSSVNVSPSYNYNDLSPELKAAKDAQDRVITRSILTGLVKDLPKEDFILQEIVNADAMKSNQPFFANAINGDKIVIFKEVERAILFRPSENRIVNDGKLVYIAPNTVVGQ